MRRSVSKVFRVAGATLLVGAMVMGPVGHASAADLESFSAKADGFALRVMVDVSDGVKDVVNPVYQEIVGSLAPVTGELPLELPAQLFPLDQYFLRTSADADNAVTRATSKLGDGFVDLPSVTAEGVGSSDSHSEQNIALPADDLSLVTGVIGNISASVTQGPKVDGNATLASVVASLQDLASTLPAELTDAVDDLVNQVNAVLAEANTELAVLTSEIVTTVVEVCETAETLPVLGDVLGDIVDLCDVTEEVLEEVVTANLALPALENPFDLPALATVTELVNVSTAQQTDDNRSVADASSTIKTVDVLNGFLTVDAIDLTSHAETAGSPGSAKVDGSCTIGDVTIAGEYGATFGDEGLVVTGVPLPAELGDVVNDALVTVQDALDEVFALLGLNVALCDDSQSAVGEDGLTAMHSVSAFRIDFAPAAPVAIGDLVAAGEPLVHVLIDPTVSTAVAAQPQVAGESAQPAPSLPRTGAPFAVTVFTGLMLVAGSMFLRRRVR